MPWSHIEDRILQLLRGQAKSDKWVFSVLGPESSGKSESLNSAIERAKAESFKVAYLDASQAYLSDGDQFFRWIFEALIALEWPLNKPLAPRLDFVREMVSMASKLQTRSLLVIDHMECLSDENARDLVSRLREYQENVDRANSKQVLCVVAGRISMQELSRRANSPNLQFDFETLPPWNRINAMKEAKQYFENKGLKVDKDALTKLTEYTGGEPAFLAMLERYLPALSPKTMIQGRNVEKAVNSLFKSAMHEPQLRHLAEFYWIDHELQRCVDLLVNKRPAFLRDGRGVVHDIDILQLRGALVAQSEHPYRYEFRNGIIRKLFKALHNARHRPLQVVAKDDGLDHAAKAMWSLQEPQDLNEWRSSLAEAWKVLLQPSKEMKVNFLFQPQTPDLQEEPWAKAAPNASCSVKISPRFLIVAEVPLRGDWILQAEITPGADFDLSVRRRHLVELWLSFLARGAERALLLHHATVGEKALISRQQRQTGPQNRSVFIVHGRNSAKRKAMDELLRALSLDPLDWDKATELTKNKPPNIFEIIDAGMSNAQACLVLLSGDDEARLMKGFRSKNDESYEHKLTPQARANVIFEAGMALGRYRHRTILVQFGPIRPFSDLRGFWILRDQDQEDLAFRKRLIRLLKAAKCPADDSTDLWKTAGTFLPDRGTKRGSAPRAGVGTIGRK
jgi:predicted nucleotide-binding protein